MRILVVTGSEAAAVEGAIDSMKRGTTRDVGYTMRPFVKLQKGDTEVHFKPIRTDHDVQSLRGLRYDLVIEEYTFNHERSWVRAQLLDEVKMIVLR